MRRALRLFSLVFVPGLLLAVATERVAAQQPAEKKQHGDETMAAHILLGPNDLKWVDGPPSLPPGAKMAVLEGDPTKAGAFTVRFKMPADFKVPPHWHSAMEHVTVLSGTLFMGMGDKLDASVAKELPAGGFAVMPAKTNHFAFSKQETVIQVHGMGPFDITYLNADDDPRKKKP